MARTLLTLLGVIAAFALGYYVRGERAPSTPNPSTAVEQEIAISTFVDTSEAEERYEVVKVIDGDTFVVSMNGKNVTVRLIGIDTPETVDPRKTVQCFGKEASEKAREMLSGQSVWLEMDPTQGELDKYGRMLAYTFLEDGTNVAEHLIAEGYGHEYMYNLPYRYQAEFKAAEDTARAEKRGLWADDACAGPASSFQLPASSEMRNPNAGAYECARNAYNCSSFKTQAEAQAAFDACGGGSNDVHKLDADGDGRVCESLP